MKLKQIPLALSLALVIGVMASGCARDDKAVPADAEAVAEAADADAHDDVQDPDHSGAVAHAPGVDFPVPENHVPWAPDAPLVEGMSRVRTAIGGLEGQPHPDEATVLARATDVDDAIKYMFANCKLDAEPDAALHAILARLMADTRALRATPADTAPVADMHAAVENYEHVFDDPKSDGDAAS